MKAGPITKFCRALPLIAMLAACGGITISIFHATVDRSSHSGLNTLQFVVVNDPVTWATLWAAHTSPLIPSPPLPPIDFSSRTVVGVFLGTRPNGCFGVRIEDIQSTSDRIVVYFFERHPHPGEVCTQAITTPAHIVTVSRTGLPVEFIKTN